MRTVLVQLTLHQFTVDTTSQLLVQRLVTNFTLFRSDSGDLVVVALNCEFHGCFADELSIG